MADLDGEAHRELIVCTNLADRIQARALNDIRRHLDRNERRALIEAGLKAKK